MRKAFVFFALIISVIGNSQIFNLVKDCSTATVVNSSYAQEHFTTVGNIVFFTARTATCGDELWKTDGTADGTVMVKDIAPGMTGSYITTTINLNGTLYFAADDGGHGTELWKSDGTTAGTVLVKDINTGRAGSVPSNFVIMNGLLYFQANDGIHGMEVWKSDGTSAGTTIVKDIRPGTEGSNIGYFGLAGGNLYFSASDGVHGNELWKSDGTSAGTLMVKDIKPGPASSDLYSLIEVNGIIVFTADDGINGGELWKTDGTDAGTVLVKDINPGPASSTTFLGSKIYAVANGYAYFNANGGAVGNELWKTDGTSAGTVLVRDLETGAVGSNPYNFFSYDGRVYFITRVGIYTAFWKTDGTASGTVNILNKTPTTILGMNGTVYFTTGTEIYKVTGPGNNYSEAIYTCSLPYLSKEVAVLNGNLIFGGPHAVYGNELWKSDGTVAGTSLLKNVSPDAYSSPPPTIAGTNGLSFFIVTDANGAELWKSDGTVAGTLMVKDINPGVKNSSPSYLTKANNNFFFVADNGANGRELWKTDGTVAGTAMVKDIYPGTNSSGISALTAANGVVFFVAYDPITGQELWKSDGTEAGTVMVKEIRPGTGDIINAGYFEYFNLNGILYFTANNGVTGFSLWKTDGTAAGTLMVKADIGIAEGYTDINGTLFFLTGNKTTGFNLWKSDGTEAGTIMLKLLRITTPQDETTKPSSFTNVNGTLFFIGSNSPNGQELWKSDGTVAGTIMVKDIYPGKSGSMPTYLVNLNNKLYFSANDGINGRELWTSDGTEAGTVMLKDIYQGASNSDPSYLIKFNDKIYFSAADAASGRELWETDGTSDGTVIAKDINPGYGDGLAISVISIVNNRLIFSGNDGIHGEEIWRSNGEADGTTMLQDIVPGSGGSTPKNILNVDGTIFFAATTDEIGTELYAGKLPVSPLQLTWLEFSGQKINNDALLTWKTANEMNTDKFIIERSLNGRDYSAVGSKLAFNGQGTYQYNFTDPQINLLGANIVYYRLKQIDYNGHYSYSRIVAISLTGNNVLMIYPNPAIDRTNITITTNNTEAIQLRVINHLGQIIKQQQLGVTTGSITLSLDVSGIAKGMYYLEVRGATIHETKQFLKL